MTKRMTEFRPEKNGFNFGNPFKNDFIPAFDVRTSGLCGGMSYAALDYWFSGVPVPVQPFPPANGTTLYNYLYDRQVTSLLSNADKWAELYFNPGGARNTEFFHWGISAKKGERIDELRSYIDSGSPCVLGMYGVEWTGDHQVLAIGYDMGRYQGDLGPHIEDFKIFICDPNHPGQTMTLVPDVENQVFHYLEGGGNKWRTYFVDRKYVSKRPPLIQNGHFPADGLVHELVLGFATGGDDLRGGDDNVNVLVNLLDGRQESHKNVNLGARWIDNYLQYAEVALDRAVPFEQIAGLVVSTTFTGGLNGDNWDMDSLDVHTWGGGFYNKVKSVGRTRFTGENKVLNVPVHDVHAGKGEINRLWLTVNTGGDDLRGVNDNLSVTVRFRDGSAQHFANANGGQRWADNTSHTLQLDLNRAVKPSEVASIDLQTNFGGGVGGDNWNMDSISVRATGNGFDKIIATHGFKRFTGDDRLLSIPVTLDAAGKATKLELTIKTGGDDLRGGNDNLDVIVTFSGGHTQAARNVNGSQRWANGSSHVVNFTLDHAARPSDIASIDLQTTFGGGIGGDNWDMDSVSVKAVGSGVDQAIFKSGAKRFTGDSKTLRLARA